MTVGYDARGRQIKRWVYGKTRREGHPPHYPARAAPHLHHPGPTGPAAEGGCRGTRHAGVQLMLQACQQLWGDDEKRAAVGLSELLS